MIRKVFSTFCLLLAILPALVLNLLYVLGQALHRCGVALQDGAQAAARGIDRCLDRLDP